VNDELKQVLDRAVSAHPWHGVAARARAASDLFNAYIEMVPTDVVKYELDKASGHLRLDRPQRFSSQCPTLYGFIPQTYSGPRVGERCARSTGRDRIDGDGDPMDVCVLTEKPVAHGGFLAHVKPIGGLRMIDGNQADDKIIAVLVNDVAYGHFTDIQDCPAGIVDRLQHYFLSYKQRPNDPSHHVSIEGIYDRREAFEIIELSLADYDGEIRSPSERGEVPR
jgi:inorganic pyrophosphatase